MESSKNNCSDLQSKGGLNIGVTCLDTESQKDEVSTNLYGFINEIT